MKKKVLFRGPALSQSGYGHHARQICRWLLSRDDFDVKFSVLPWGTTPWIIDRDRDNGLIGKIIDNCAEPTSGYDVAFSLQLPNEWTPGLATFNVGITAAIETDRCNPSWTEACNKMDLIIVPSEHAKNSLNPTLVTKPLVVIPEAYFDACANVSIQQLPKFSSDFNFLIFGQLTGNNPFNDRKNTFFAIKWLFEEFKNDKNVGIVLKTNVGRNTLVDKNNVTEILEKIIKEARTGDTPRLHLIHGDMTDDEVSALYRHDQIKALIAPTRGEGFGLPILEAACCDLPIITTAWSGHMDFMKKGRFVELYYQLSEVHKSRIDNNLFIPGARWAEISEHDFKTKVRKFYNKNDVPRTWAKDLGKRLREEYSFKNVYKAYDNTLKEHGI